MDDSTCSDTESSVTDASEIRQMPIRESKSIHLQYLELAAEPEIEEYRSRFHLAGRLVDLTVSADDEEISGMVHSSKAPLALIKVGNPFVGRLRTIVMPFDHADVNAHNSLFPWSLYYLENPVYPFRPNSIYKDHDQWIRNEARDTGILVALDKTPFDIRLSGGRWIFPEVELEEASKNDLEKGECIICCAKSSDMSTGGISLYHETLAWFARNLMGRVPLSVKTGYRFSGAIDVYKTYRYFFNVVTFPLDENSVESEALVRRFACGSLQEGVAVELVLNEDQHPPMIWETEAEVKKQNGGEFLVRLPGVVFECGDHELYSKAFIYWVRYQPAIPEIYRGYPGRQVRSR